MSSSSKRKVSVDDKAKPSVFDRLGPSNEHERELCREFMKKGECSYGKQCKYLHSTSRSGESRERTGGEKYKSSSSKHDVTTSSSESQKLSSCRDRKDSKIKSVVSKQADVDDIWPETDVSRSKVDTLISDSLIKSKSSRCGSQRDDKQRDVQRAASPAKTKSHQDAGHSTSSKKRKRHSDSIESKAPPPVDVAKQPESGTKRAKDAAISLRYVDAVESADGRKKEKLKQKDGSVSPLRVKNKPSSSSSKVASSKPSGSRGKKQRQRKVSTSSTSSDSSSSSGASSTDSASSSASSSSSSSSSSVDSTPRHKLAGTRHHKTSTRKHESEPRKSTKDLTPRNTKGSRKDLSPGNKGAPRKDQSPGNTGGRRKDQSPGHTGGRRTDNPPKDQSPVNAGVRRKDQSQGRQKKVKSAAAAVEECKDSASARHSSKHAAAAPRDDAERYYYETPTTDEPHRTSDARCDKRDPVPESRHRADDDRDIESHDRGHNYKMEACSKSKEHEQVATKYKYDDGERASRRSQWESHSEHTTSSRRHAERSPSRRQGDVSPSHKSSWDGDRDADKHRERASRYEQRDIDQARREPRDERPMERMREKDTERDRDRVVERERVKGTERKKKKVPTATLR